MRRIGRGQIPRFCSDGAKRFSSLASRFRNVVNSAALGLSCDAAAEGERQALVVGLAAGVQREQSQGSGAVEKPGSLSVIRACSGVSERERRTQAKSPLGASNVCNSGYGTER